MTTKIRVPAGRARAMRASKHRAVADVVVASLAVTAMTVTLGLCRLPFLTNAWQRFRLASHHQQNNEQGDRDCGEAHTLHDHERNIPDVHSV